MSALTKVSVATIQNQKRLAALQVWIVIAETGELSQRSHIENWIVPCIITGKHAGKPCFSSGGACQVKRTRRHKTSCFVLSQVHKRAAGKRWKTLTVGNIGRWERSSTGEKCSAIRESNCVFEYSAKRAGNFPGDPAN